MKNKKIEIYLGICVCVIVIGTVVFLLNNNRNEMVKNNVSNESVEINPDNTSQIEIQKNINDDKQWKELYINFIENIKDYNIELTAMYDIDSFRIADIEKDGIPELFLKLKLKENEDAKYLYMTLIYKYNNGNVENIKNIKSELYGFAGDKYFVLVNRNEYSNDMIDEIEFYYNDTMVKAGGGKRLNDKNDYSVEINDENNKPYIIALSQDILDKIDNKMTKIEYDYDNKIINTENDYNYTIKNTSDIENYVNNYSDYKENSNEYFNKKNIQVSDNLYIALEAYRDYYRTENEKISNKQKNSDLNMKYNSKAYIWMHDYDSDGIPEMIVTDRIRFYVYAFYNGEIKNIYSGGGVGSVSELDFTDKYIIEINCPRANEYISYLQYIDGSIIQKHSVKFLRNEEYDTKEKKIISENKNIIDDVEYNNDEYKIKLDEIENNLQYYNVSYENDFVDISNFEQLITDLENGTKTLDKMYKLKEK